MIHINTKSSLKQEYLMYPQSQGRDNYKSPEDKIRKKVFERHLHIVFRRLGLQFLFNTFQISRCTTIPLGCNRCDDECAKKEGK